MKISGTSFIFLLLGLFCFADARGPRTHIASNKARQRGLKDVTPMPQKQEKEAKPREMSAFRLPTDLNPTHQLNRFQYFIYEGNFTFNGYSEISIDCITATSSIVLHYRDLDIDYALTTVQQVGGGTIEVLSQIYETETEFYTLNLGQTLEAGQSYVLSITFTGPLNEFYSGCWRLSYLNGTDDVWFMVSDYEPIDARNCFPSFDEIIYKIPFTTQIIREDHLLSASNGPLVSSTSMGNGWTLDEFQTTVPMTTYLNAFHVSDFSIVSTSSNGIDYGVYTRPGFESWTDYALFLGPNITEGFENRFQTAYAMPKQDMIALSEFGAGAMENWGFITYLDYYLLHDPVLSSIFDKQSVCEVISHELAHQWFGNLINAEWWSHIWLQEGFATYYEYLGCGDAEPSMEEDGIFLRSELQYILGVDDTPTINPLIYELYTLDDIYNTFNTITYAKGGSMTRMMQYFLTQPTFEAALETYLATYTYGNVFQDDLFLILNDQAMIDGTLDPSLTVKQIMDPFTFQPGYPLVTVDRSANDGTASLTQQRFFADQSNSDSTTWYIPITYTTQASPDFTQFNEEWMLQGETQKTITGVPLNDQWVVFNIQLGGYYRVNYDSNNWALLANQLVTDHTVIEMKNRAQILNDAYNLAHSNVITFDIPFDQTNYLCRELSYTPVSAALDELEKIDGQLRRQSAYGDFKNFLTQITVPLYDRVGFSADSTSDPSQDQMIRALVSEVACYIGHEPCLTDSSSLFSQWMASPSDHSIIGANIRYTVYCAAVQSGGSTEWDFVYNQYLRYPQFPAEKERLLFALGCTEENFQLTNFLDMAFDDTSGIPKSQVRSVIEASSESIIGEDVTWDYIRGNDVAIASYMGSSDFVALYVNIVSRKFNTNERLTELTTYKDAFTATFGAGADTTLIDAAIDDTNENILWMTNNYDEIAQWVAGNTYDCGSS